MLADELDAGWLRLQQLAIDHEAWLAEAVALLDQAQTATQFAACWERISELQRGQLDVMDRIAAWLGDHNERALAAYYEHEAS